MDRNKTIASISDHSDETLAKPREELQSMDEVLIRKLEEVIEENLNNEQFSVEELSDAVAMSRSHLHRKLHKINGTSISQFVRSYRLNRSYELLEKEVGTVSEVAFKVGFGSSSYFIKCFNELYGFSPGDVKRRKNEIEEHLSNSSIEQAVTIEHPKKVAVEQLHPAVSEGIIREIFEAMVAHKPSLGKFMLVDEDEGEVLDTRILAYQIFKNYPWPIGVEIRRLFSAGLQSSSDQRVQQLNKTILRTLRINFFVLVCELVQRIQSGDFPIAEEQKKTILNCLESMSKDDLFEAIESLVTILNAAPSQFFENILQQTFTDSFLREISDWAGYEGADEDRADELEQIVTFLTKKSAYLLRYKFVSVNQIEVLKSKFQDAEFEHSIHLMNNAEADFHIHREVLKQFSDSRAVLLMRSIKNSQEFLNLSPFVVDTHHLTTTSDQRSPQKDTYLFDGIEDGRMKFIGTAITQRVDLLQFEGLEFLHAEYDQIVRILSQ